MELSWEEEISKFVIDHTPQRLVDHAPFLSHTLTGLCIQVGRPNNVPQAAPVIAAIQEEASKYPRIYVASIHTDLSSDDVKRLK